MAERLKVLLHMHDLTGAGERRTTLMLALLVAGILLLPLSPSAAQIARPGDPADASTEAAPTPTPTPTPTATPTPTPTTAPPPLAEDDGEPTLADMLEDFEEQLADGEGEGEPSPPGEPGTGGGSGEVEAEGGDAQEVVEAPQAPQPAEGEVAAEGEGVPAEAPVEGEEAAAEDTGVAPPPIETYGVSVVPSLGTAARPLTDPVSGEPLVLAPMVAGQQIVPGTTDVAVSAEDPAILRVAAEPVRNVAAASLSVVQPSWYATTLALLVLLGAASYGAVLRRRGEEVPEAIAFTGAVRPGDRRPSAARSVRPVDMQRSVRSVRP